MGVPLTWQPSSSFGHSEGQAEVVGARLATEASGVVAPFGHVQVVDRQKARAWDASPRTVPKAATAAIRRRCTLA
jgi:hypothetical protein